MLGLLLTTTIYNDNCEKRRVKREESHEREERVKESKNPPANSWNPLT
jgi:hypothetical protein